MNTKRNAATIEYVARRMNDLQKEHAGIPVRVKINTRVPDARKTCGYRIETTYGIVQYVATATSIGNGPLMVNIEADAVSYSDLEGHELVLDLGPSR